MRQTGRTPEARHVVLRPSMREFTEFNKELGSSLRAALDLESPRYLSMVKLPTPVSSVVVDYGLMERGRETSAIDDRGTEQPAVHIGSHLDQHLLLALNYGWKQSPRGLHFKQLQIIVFLAWGSSNLNQVSLSSRRQLLRLEWEGVDDSGLFVNNNAAHPHWNIDQWLTGYDTGDALRTRLSFADTLQEFGGAAGAAETRPAVRWMRAVHLAAAARWADEPWSDDGDCHVHAAPPKNLVELKNWATSAVRYVSQQFRAAIDRS